MFTCWFCFSFEFRVKVSSRRAQRLGWFAAREANAAGTPDSSDIVVECTNERCKPVVSKCMLNESNKLVKLLKTKRCRLLFTSLPVTSVQPGTWVTIGGEYGQYPSLPDLREEMTERILEDRVWENVYIFGGYFSLFSLIQCTYVCLLSCSDPFF